jgi:hypothetical protein
VHRERARQERRQQEVLASAERLDAAHHPESSEPTAGPEAQGRLEDAHHSEELEPTGPMELKAPMEHREALALREVQTEPREPRKQAPERQASASWSLSSALNREAARAFRED